MTRVRVESFTLSLDGIDLPALGHACAQHVATPQATHLVLARR